MLEHHKSLASSPTRKSESEIEGENKPTCEESASAPGGSPSNRLHNDRRTSAPSSSGQHPIWLMFREQSKHIMQWSIDHVAPSSVQGRGSNASELFREMKHSHSNRKATPPGGYPTLVAGVSSGSVPARPRGLLALGPASKATDLWPAATC